METIQDQGKSHPKRLQGAVPRAYTGVGIMPFFSPTAKAENLIIYKAFVIRVLQEYLSPNQKLSGMQRNKKM